MRITSSGGLLVIGAELIVDVEAVDVVNGNHPQLGEIPILWQLVKPSIHTARPVLLVIHNKPLQSSDMKVSV